MKMFLFLTLFTVMALTESADAGIFRHRCGGQRSGIFQRAGNAGCQAAAETVPQKGVSFGQSSADVLACINAERARFGLPALELCPAMSAQAQGHVERYGFVHSRLGYRENIARGQTTGEWAVSSWMNSRQGHRENILTNGATKIGVGNVGDIWIVCIE